METTTMLVVDDDEMNRQILKVLFDSKYAVLEAESGEEGLAMLESCSGNIDLVLLDLIMPGMSGFDVLKKRMDMEDFKTVPVVVITSSSAMEDQVHAFELGANDYITKPFVPEIVLSRVNNVLASHRRYLTVELEAQKLKVRSELDQMTGLYNKNTVEYLIHENLKNVQVGQNVMFVIDIDNFKSVNDISGHLAGDHVIKIIADMLSSHFRKTDIVGRIGGDEFVVLMVDVPTKDIVYRKVNELIQIMRYKPNLTIPENVTLSIGIACNERIPTSYSELFHKADEALYRAKEDGKACYREYGVEPVNLDDDERQVVLLISRNRSVCSIILGNMPQEVRVVEALTLDDLKRIKPRDTEKISMIYADVSEYQKDGEKYWQEMAQYPWVDFEKTIAICEEGEMSQYKAALLNGVSDILATPLDSNAVKRRTLKQLGNK
ncbi:MAG: diguanylate cyclase [Lachnospiraceae bacterium]|nr:diguanylate cyclase [Lachnospiraceae bacterium]MDD3615332.1 diguanylate cyclase [Lachnospiraceae bacterium]